MPIGRAKAMLDEFQAKGRITRPALGIMTVYVAGDLAEMLQLPPVGGLLIQRVERGSAAEEAGLRGPRQRVVVGGTYPLGVGGDFIMAVEGQPVEGNDSLQKILARKRAGENLRFTVFRNGRSQDITVKLGEAPQTL
jgi:serine protease Do